MEEHEKSINLTASWAETENFEFWTVTVNVTVRGDEVAEWPMQQKVALHLNSHLCALKLCLGETGPNAVRAGQW